MKTNRLISLIAVLILCVGILLSASAAYADGGTDAPSYTVEFYYGEKEYVIPGSSSISLSELLCELGLTGDISSWEVSDPGLFNVVMDEDTGTPRLISLQPFHTEEWLKVFIDGAEYEILVTDDDTAYTVSSGYSGQIKTKMDESIAVTADDYYTIANPPTIVKQSQSTDSIYDFAAGLPLSTIYIDESKFGELKGIYKLENPSLSDVLVYNASTNKVNYDPRLIGGHLENNAPNRLDGPLFSFTFNDAAILPDGSKANVKITYSNVVIYTDERLYAMEQAAANQAQKEAAYYAGAVTLAKGSVITYEGEDSRNLNQPKGGLSSAQVNAGKAAISARVDQYKSKPGLSSLSYSVMSVPVIGKSMDVTYEILNNEGNPVDGTFIYAMVGVTLERDPYRLGAHNAGKGLWWVNDLYPDFHFLNEQIAVTNNTIASDYIYVRPNNTLYEQDGNARTQGFGPQVFEKNENGILKTKFIANAYEYNGVRLDTLDGFYSSGFVTMAKSGFTISSYGHGASGLGMNTQSYGGRRIWYRYTHASGPNGNIQTTSEGNHGGNLNDKADNGKNSNILDPDTYVVAEGKTITYTLTPSPKYQIAKLYCTINGGTLQEIKYNGKPLSAMKPGDSLTYTDAAGKTCTLTAFSDGNEGVKFTLVIPYAQHDEEVRVEWQRHTAEITVKKDTVDDKVGSFGFKIKAWKTEDVLFYNPLEVGSLWLNKHDLTSYESAFKNGAACSKTPSELAGLAASVVLTERVEIAGGHYLWKTNKKLSDLGITGGSDDDYLFVGFFNAASATIGSTLDVPLNTGLNSTYGPEVIQFYHPQPETRAVTTYWDFENEKGTETVIEHEFQVNSGSEVKFEIEEKYRYELYEQTQDGWELISVNGSVGANLSSGYLSEGTDNTPEYVYLNQKRPILTVEKITENNAPGTFNYTVKFTTNGTDPYEMPNPPSGASYDSDNNQYTFSLSNGESKVFLNLPYGICYEVHEASAEGWVLINSSNTSKEDLKDDITASFTNRRLLDLKVSKTVSGNQGSRDKYFKISVNLDTIPDAVLTLDTANAALAPEGSMATVYTAADMAAANSRDDDSVAAGQQLIAASGVVTFDFYLRHGDEFVIKNIPYGAQYTISETAEDYTPALAINGDKLTDDGVSDTDIPVGEVSSAADTLLAKNTDLAFTNTKATSVPTGVNDFGQHSLLAVMAGIQLLIVFALLTMHFIRIQKMQRQSR